MAKEANTTRIPRLDGVSRIPLPGTCLRPPTVVSLPVAVVQPANPVIRPTQVFRTPAVGFAKQRPNSFGGLRPPTQVANVIKKSASGERLNNAVNMMSKKTTTALKKFFGKAEKLSPNCELRTPARNTVEQPKINQTVVKSKATPPNAPLMRSETFVRSDSEADMLGITQDLEATPVPSKRMICESTPLLSSNSNRQLLYSAQFHDTQSESSRLAADRTHIVQQPCLLAEATFNKTIVVDSPMPKPPQSAAQCLPLNNLTQTLNGTQLLGQTRCVISPTKFAQQNALNNNTVTLNSGNLTKTIHSTQFMETFTANEFGQTFQKSTNKENLELISPVTNATFSNPGSIDNLQLLEDISIPSGLDGDNYPELLQDNMDVTLTALAPDKSNMKLPLNSTMCTERLLDITGQPSPARHIQLLNLTKDYMDTPRNQTLKNNTQLLYMSQRSTTAATMTPDRPGKLPVAYQHTPIPANLLSPMFLKGAQSDLVLPTRTPDDDLLHAGNAMDVDTTLVAIGSGTQQFYDQSQERQTVEVLATSLQDINNPNAPKQKSRFSFGLDLTESTLDCSIELVDVSLSSTAHSQPSNSGLHGSSNMSHSASSQQLQQQFLRKQSSFDMDESLGILTPDQMKEFLDSTNTNTNTNNLELPLSMPHAGHNQKMTMQQMRIDQTPSPEELPLDPVEVKTDITEMVVAQQQQQQQRQQQLLQQSATSTTEPYSNATDTELSKAEQLSKSNVSKISTSFITSVTSVTSLDTGYQGDGEMSRPASRGACDHSPSSGPNTRKGVSRQPSFNQQQHQQLPPIRRQDPMTDSDFFTESDADDIFHRGDRRAQVIDGHLYGPTMQPAASVFISEDPQMEDSCMESSGIFTDVENRCDEDLMQMRCTDRTQLMQDSMDMSPEGDDSAKTVKSNTGDAHANAQHNLTTTAATTTATTLNETLGQGQLSCSQTSSTLESSQSTDRLTAATLSNRTSYCSVDGNSAVECKSFASLEEAFNGANEYNNNNNSNNNSASSNNNVRAKVRPKSSNIETTFLAASQSVQHLCSPRKHASLTSLACKQSNNSKSNNNSNKNNNQNNSNNNNGNINSNNNCHGSGGDIYKCSNECAGGTHVKSSSIQSVHTATGSRKVSTSSSCESVKSKANSIARAKRSQQSLHSSTSPTPSQGPAIGTTPASAKRKTPSPSKWDAVMNKIAINKTALAKKNYNDVKSKVSTMRAESGVSVKSASASVSASASASGCGSPKTPQKLPNASGSATRRVPLASVNCNTRLKSSPKGATTNASSSPSTTNSRASPVARKEPTDTGSAAHGKRLTVIAAKRGRSFSKDSQKSSQSDLSLTSGSPKLLAKTPIRAAKKRDVRNLSISPTDLGPPPKTQQTANGTSTRNKQAIAGATTAAIAQNRSSAAYARATSISPTTTTSTSQSGTPSPISHKYKDTIPLNKKQSLPAKRGDIKGAANNKSPLKDHNRTAQPTSFIHKNAANKAATAAAAAAINAANDIPNEYDELINGGDCVTYNNNNINDNNNHRKTITTNIENATVIANGDATLHKIASHALEKKALGGKQQFLQQPSRKVLQQKQSTNQLSTKNAIARLDYGIDTQQMKLLQRHSYGGAGGANNLLDYTATTRALYHLEHAQQHRGVEALGVLLQYLVFDLDAFACPLAKLESAKAKESLSKTLHLLDEAKHACSELQEQICDKEAYFTQREQELQTLHRCELEKAQANLAEFQQLAKDKFTDLEQQLAAKDAAHKAAIEAYKQETDNRYALKLQHLLEAEEREQKLQQRLQEMECAELQLREQLTQTENACANRLKAATEREQELEDRIKSLNRELESLRLDKEHSERELKDRLNLTQDEVSVLRSSRKSLERASSPRVSLGNTSNCSLNEITRLESEAESLRCVLELKQKEISKLTKHNEELLRDADERISLQGKISLLESKNEMLQSELNIKSDREKDLLRQIDEVQKALGHETTKRTRLSYDNEALQWQLKQRSEQLHIVEAKLQESLNTSSCTHNTSNGSQQQQLRSSMLNGSVASMNMDDVSPPASPVVKGVIEKVDSVSWVLEMDDDTPETAATKIVKRAGSFRAGERSPATKRQLNMSGSGLSTSPTPIPLSQSMSATAVVISSQHSSENMQTDFPNRTHPRVRSKSMTVKYANDGSGISVRSAKRLTRQLSANGAGTSSSGSNGSISHAQQQRKQQQQHDNSLLGTWHEPMIVASSPYGCKSSRSNNSNSSKTGMRPRTSTMKMSSSDIKISSEQSNGKISNASDADLTSEQSADLITHYRRTSAGSATKLITCDSAALKQGEPLELLQRSMSSCNSMHNLKTTTLRIQEIQESAGEAMVSGTNSEDESCSASSDEMLQSTESSSIGSTKDSEPTTTSLNQAKATAHLLLDEVLLLEKPANSLTGTPMEMSWSEDVEGFEHGSVA